MTTNNPVREKHVANVGRWRIAWRFGHYKTGYHSRGLPHFAGALPFVWFSVVRRNNRPQPHATEKQR